ncbi:mycothiol acetyltransferase [Fusarium longipes]|uniref:Mycothiol acetyltransferase n=1 Tax=Fusarium longipes TaxID=694270 RepID=A0A395SYT1_9HYPO|nr:mycothiol acetyltransferase [Fusarium longipes]
MADQSSNGAEAPSTQHEIRQLANSDDDIQKSWQMWQTIFHDWPIDKSRFTKLLFGLPGYHWIHENGFCLSYMIDGATSLRDGAHGRITAIGVLPEYRRQGIGSALLEKAKIGLVDAARSNGEELKSLEVGSIFPRFWWQIPKTVSEDVKQFFSHRGIYITSQTIRDLYKDITHDIAPPEIMDRVSKTKAKFSPWSAELYEECMTKQRAQFSWAGVYESLASQNQHDQILVAFDSDTNEQIGWTLMCSYDSAASDVFAFLPLLPSGEKTGLIAAVGVDEKARGKGIGLALVIKAMETLKERGMEGILIDAVEIRGFYERLGFETFQEYEGCSPPPIACAAIHNKQHIHREKHILEDTLKNPSADNVLLPLLADDLQLRMKQTVHETNERVWRLDTEADVENWFNSEVVSVVLTGWAKWPQVMQNSHTKPLRTDIKESVDSVFAVKIGGQEQTIAIGEYKWNLISERQWNSPNAITNKRQEHLSQELRGYAFKYGCPQVFSFDGFYLILLQFRAKSVEDIRHRDCPVDCWVVSATRDGAVPLRVALYRLLMQGWRRVQGNSAPLQMIGGRMPHSREWYSGSPLWEGERGLQRQHPGGFTRQCEPQTGKLFWRNGQGLKSNETGHLWSTPSENQARAGGDGA